jgi:hypothetical protein
MPSRIQLRRDTAENWTFSNPVLTAGEPGLENNTRLIKYGDGITPWNELGYAAVSAAVSNLVPDDPIPGMLWYDSSVDQMKVYVEGEQLWQPLAPKHIRFSFSESTYWLVQHNRNTTAYSVSLTDSEGDQFYAKIRVIDNNSFSINLADSASGVADVTFL